MTQQASEGQASVVTVAFEGTTARFSDAHVCRDSPGRLFGALYEGRFYEEDLLRRIRSLGIRGGVYLDLGAAIGTHSVFFALVCGADTVHCVEPRPDVADQLRTNLELNGLGERAVVHRVAATDIPGPVPLGTGPDAMVVPGRRADRLVTDRVAVVKVDVDGMEPEALRSAGRILRRDRPALFVTAASAPDYEAVVRTLRRYGYKPSGHSFGATAVHEFVPIPRGERISGSRPVRPVLRRLSPRARRMLGRLVRGAVRRSRSARSAAGRVAGRVN